MYFCEKKNPRRLCEAVEAPASAALGKLARRPFNRFKAIETPWWLVPSADLPFFHHGKLYFDWGNGELGDTILCGYYLEKGLGPELASLYPSKKGRSWIMNEKWQWRNFVSSCADGSFFKMLRIARERSGLDFELHVSGGYVDDPGLFDPYNDRLKKDSYVFDLDAMDEAVKYRCARRDAMVLKMLNKVKCFADLQGAVATLDADSFLWLNIFIALRFKVYPQEPPAEKEVMDSVRLWNDCLSVFSGLIR